MDKNCISRVRNNGSFSLPGLWVAGMFAGRRETFHNVRHPPERFAGGHVTHDRRFGFMCVKFCQSGSGWMFQNVAYLCFAGPAAGHLVIPSCVCELFDLYCVVGAVFAASFSRKCRFRGRRDILWKCPSCFFSSVASATLQKFGVEIVECFCEYHCQGSVKW